MSKEYIPPPQGPVPTRFWDIITPLENDALNQKEFKVTDVSEYSNIWFI